MGSQTFGPEQIQIIKSIAEKHTRPANEIILDDVDLRDFLKISRRTALEYRKSGLLVYYKLDAKIYYFLSDIIDFVKKAGGRNEK